MCNEWLIYDSVTYPLGVAPRVCIMRRMLPPARLPPALAAAIVLFVGLSVETAAAGAAPNRTHPRCEDAPTCNELLVKARGFSRARQNEDALSLYLAAYKVRPDPLLLYMSSS